LVVNGSQLIVSSVVPLEPATMPGRVVAPREKDDCADMGIVKVDLLGLEMMAAPEDTIKMIPEVYGDRRVMKRHPASECSLEGTR
jgi:error-prone DNA polymerase